MAAPTLAIARPRLAATPAATVTPNSTAAGSTIGSRNRLWICVSASHASSSASVPSETATPTPRVRRCTIALAPHQSTTSESTPHWMCVMPRTRPTSSLATSSMTRSNHEPSKVCPPAYRATCSADQCPAPKKAVACGKTGFPDATALRISHGSSAASPATQHHPIARHAMPGRSSTKITTPTSGATNSSAVGFAPHATPTSPPAISPRARAVSPRSSATPSAAAPSSTTAISLYASEPTTIVQGVTSTSTPASAAPVREALPPRPPREHAALVARATIHEASTVMPACSACAWISPWPLCSTRPHTRSPAAGPLAPPSTPTCANAASM